MQPGLLPTRPWGAPGGAAARTAHGGLLEGLQPGLPTGAPGGAAARAAHGGLWRGCSQECPQGLLEGPQPGLPLPTRPRGAPGGAAVNTAPHTHTHLAPVGGSMQWLPAITVPGAQAGSVPQQQDGYLTEAIGRRYVQLQARPNTEFWLPGRQLLPHTVAGSLPVWPHGPGAHRDQPLPATSPERPPVPVAPAQPGPPQCFPG